MTTPDLQAVAHMNPDGRVVPGRTMRDAVRDGGAMLSSLRGYSVPLVRRKDALARIEALERERDAALADARRYRAIRFSARPGFRVERYWFVGCEDLPGVAKPCIEALEGDALDSAIDAAINAQEQP